MTDAEPFILPMRAWDPAGVAPSWADCLSLLALMSSLHLLAAEDGMVLGGKGQMCGCHE